MDSQKEKFAPVILKVLSESKKPLLAKEIASILTKKAGLKLKRKDVNACLFSKHLRFKVIQDANFRWSVRPDNFKASNGSELSESLIENRELPELGISVELIKQDQVFTFKAMEATTQLLFDTKKTSDSLDIYINCLHPCNTNLFQQIVNGDGEKDNPSYRTLKLILAAWAKLEDEAEGQRKIDLENIRLDWGIIARDLHQLEDHE